MKRNRHRNAATDQAEPVVAPLPAHEIAASLEILVEDGPLLAVNKPAGMLSQGAPQGVFGLPDYVKSYLKHKYDKPGNVYLGVIHRLDRPVTGVVVFSRNSKGAARLSEQFRDRTVKKTYLAILENTPAEPTGTLVDFIAKVPDQARAVIEPEESPTAKRAELNYEVLTQHERLCLVKVEPTTGRMHQIRLQLASRGYPILGDQLYGAGQTLDLKPLTSDYTERIALHASMLQLKHPVRYDDLTISAPLPADWPKFARSIMPPSE